MPAPLIDTPQALDVAIAAMRHGRREKLLRAARNQRIRTQVAFVLSAVIATFAVVAFFFAVDREASVILALISCMSVCWTYAAGKTGRKKAVDALRGTDQSV
jgi:hypothetical protein